jgi:hypothetical protein
MLDARFYDLTGQPLRDLNRFGDAAALTIGPGGVKFRVRDGKR